MDARFVRASNGIGQAPQIEGTSNVAGAASAGGGVSTSGGATIMNQNPPSVNRTIIFWGIAVGVLVLFHVGGARLG